MTHSHYGGHVDKVNYLSKGSIDETTDVDADELCRLAADMEAIVRTADFAHLTYLCNDTSPAAPTIESVLAMIGVDLEGYEGDAAPGAMPSAARVSDGAVTFTFASSYSDPYGVSGSFTLRCASATVHGSAAAGAVVSISGQTVTVRVFDEDGNAVQDARVSLSVS